MLHRRYSVLEHPVHGFIAIARDFNWYALIFGPLYYVFKRLYINALVSLFCLISSGFFSIWLLANEKFATAFLLFILINYTQVILANDVNYSIRNRFVLAGYRFVASVYAMTPMRSIKKHLQQKKENYLPPLPAK